MRIETSVEVALTTYRHTDLTGILGNRIHKIPYVLRLLSENHIRETRDVKPLLTALDAWLEGHRDGFEFTFQPNRILMHDTTCTPALADIAGLRDAVAEAGGDPKLLSPQLPVEVSVDHSLAVDQYANPSASDVNIKNEIIRNNERYAFMKWASANMEGVHVNPPGTGIMHTINLEQLATVLEINSDGPEITVHPDMLLGTDSHTPMINGIGVMGWGVGGLEAESVMFGQPASLAMPEVIGVRLKGKLPAGVLATDLALEVTHQLRKIGATGSFVEFFGVGVSTLNADARSVVANMAPEYGASTGYFPVDEHTIEFLERTGRPQELTSVIRPVMKAMGLWFDPDNEPHFDRQIKIDLGELSPLIAGPRRPQDRCEPKDAQARVEEAIGRKLEVVDNSNGAPDGAVGVAAITSCTNTSDPRLLLAAGLLAKKARNEGMKVPNWVKTSLAPGSPSAKRYLERAGLLDDLSAMGFDIVGHGCTTCIGNSGPLPQLIELALQEGKAISAVLSGNRNFPGRVHPKLNLGFLTSPPLVVAYAIKGVVNGNILKDALGERADGTKIYLSDIWPREAEIEAAMRAGFKTSDVANSFAKAAKNLEWKKIKYPQSVLFPWNPKSRNLRRPKFASLDEKCRLGKYIAKPLMVLGDDMTTDHISPAGWIDPNSISGKWLIERGGDPNDLNVYASYRGNWEVMLRGLFTNRLARNYLADALEPSYTVLENEEPMPVFKAAESLNEEGISAVLFAGERYGMGSSRDWAAKGAALLGVRAVIARSFERIHRTNLIGMGVLPIEIIDAFSPHTAGIKASDAFEINIPPSDLSPHAALNVNWTKADGSSQIISCRIAVETKQEISVLLQGGVLPAILNKAISAQKER